MLIVAQRFPQRARVAPAAATPIEVGEPETSHGDIVVPGWDEQYVPHPTVSTAHPPYIDYAAPQLTVPLPSLEAALRDYKELAATQDRRV
ncbi:MAG TPA: hypothetical protein VND68_07160 [Chloroflexia bacterium]|jgi:hypothetical protein|nr:hypothetical protein [Chloroflexia bacterium]